jgi:hypothetical protein
MYNNRKSARNYNQDAVLVSHQVYMCEKESELSINLKNHHDRVTRAGVREYMPVEALCGDRRRRDDV